MFNKNITLSLYLLIVYKKQYIYGGLFIVVYLLGGCSFFSDLSGVLPTIQPIPKYLQISNPAPNGIYEISNSIPVCLYIETEYLLKPEDKNISSDVWYEGSILFVDGKNMGKPNEILNLLGIDSRGNAIGPYDQCWFIKNLSMGWHTLEHQVTDTSGIIHSYTWEFQLE